MAILFSAVGRSSVVLAKHALCAGNFVDVCEQVLARIDPTKEERLSYAHGRYLLHYVTHDRLTYVCITDETFERSRAFAFLAEVQRGFERTYGRRALAAIPYAMNTEFAPFLAAQMRHYSSSATSSVDKRRQTSGPLATTSGAQQQPANVTGYGAIDNNGNNNNNAGTSTGDRVKAQVEDLKQIMIRNMESLSGRGEKMQLLVDRSTELETSSMSFQTQSVGLKRSLLRNNVKIGLWIAAAVGLIVLLIAMSACGGFTFPNC